MSAQALEKARFAEANGAFFCLFFSALLRKTG
jgi:hypothetical protein